MKRLIRWLTYKPYGCPCGKRYRDGRAQSKCVWRHALEA